MGLFSLNGIKRVIGKGVLGFAPSSSKGARVEPSMEKDGNAQNTKPKSDLNPEDVIKDIKNGRMTAFQGISALDMETGRPGLGESRQEELAEAVKTIHEMVDAGEVGKNNLNHQQLTKAVYNGDIEPDRAEALAPEEEKRGKFVNDGDSYVSPGRKELNEAIEIAKARNVEPDNEQRTKELHELPSAKEQLEQVKAKAIAAAEETTRGRFVNAGTKQDPVMVSPEWAGVIEELDNRVQHEQETGKAAPLSEGDLELPSGNKNAPVQDNENAVGR